MFESENTPTFSGRDGSLALFTYENRGVVVDTDVNLVVQTGLSEALFSSKDWELSEEEFSSTRWRIIFVRPKLQNSEVLSIVFASNLQ